MPGTKVFVAARLDPNLVKRLDEYAQSQHTTRSHAIRHLVAEALGA